MITQTLRRRGWFGVALGSLLLPGFCAAGPDLGEPVVEVSVYNEAKVAPALLGQAEAMAAAMFEQAGLNVDWANCGLSGESSAESQRCSEARFPTHLHLRILAVSRGLRQVTLGLSYLDADGRGCYSEVFFAQVEDISERAGERAAVILGHVMAHEIGHLLLGTNSHSALGLMKAHWGGRDLQSAGRGELLFTAQEANLMREKLFHAWSARTTIATRNGSAAD